MQDLGLVSLVQVQSRSFKVKIREDSGYQVGLNTRSTKQIPIPRDATIQHIDCKPDMV